MEWFIDNRFILGSSRSDNLYDKVLKFVGFLLLGGCGNISHEKMLVYAGVIARSFVCVT
jgi:hypothetical protein